MGRRSRKRVTTRADRDAARRERAAAGGPPPSRPGRPRAEDRPSAPWGSFPLSELVILVGIVVLVWGIASGGSAGNERIGAGLVLASLGGGELALREHLAGFKSHTTLLSGVAAFVVVTAVVLIAGRVNAVLALALAIVVFASAFYGLRELFKRRSGGVSFR
jgi:hypothetical protein